MKRLLIGGIAIVILIGIGLGGYFTISNNIKKENALKIVQLNKQKADEKKANDKKIADEKAQAIEDARLKAIADAQAIKDKAIADAKALADSKIMDEVRVYNKMHQLINSKIVAIDKQVWGEQVITPTVCNELLQIIKDNNFSDGAKLTSFLNSWKNKDFSDAVAEHNYIWSKLGGVDGKAIARR